MRTFILLALVCLPLYAQNATTPGAITDELPTCNCLGFRWAISGDADLDCAVNVEYRAVSTSAWSQAQPMLPRSP